MTLKHTVVQGMAAWRAQNITSPRNDMMVIPVGQLESLIADAERGDRRAYSYATAIADWLRMAETSVDDATMQPSCAGCHRAIKRSDTKGRGDVVAWVVVAPVVAAPDSICLVAPICFRCGERERNDLMDSICATIEGEVGGKVMMEQ